MCMESLRTLSTGRVWAPCRQTDAQYSNVDYIKDKAVFVEFLCQHLPDPTSRLNNATLDFSFFAQGFDVKTESQKSVLLSPR